MNMNNDNINGKNDMNNNNDNSNKQQKLQQIKTSFLILPLGAGILNIGFKFQILCEISAPETDSEVWTENFKRNNDKIRLMISFIWMRSVLWGIRIRNQKKTARGSLS